MTDALILSLSGFAAGLSIGGAAILVYRAERDAARRDADLTRSRLAVTMADVAAWKAKAHQAGWTPPTASRPGLLLVVSNERSA